jgi:hypothetical protein
MKIRLQDRLSAVGCVSPAGASRCEAGDTLAKTLVSVAFVGVVVALLYVAFSVGFHVIQSTREDLRASQIVLQRAEALRLFTWSQVCDTNYHRKPLFVEPRDSLGLANNRGDAQYAGYLSAPVSGAGERASVSHRHLRPVTVTVCWTNFDGARPIVHRREVQARLAPNGMPKYLWEVL